MNITSIHFVTFTVLALMIYHVLGRRLQNYWLLLVSYAFIAIWEWQFVIAIIAITIVNFLIALKLRMDDQGRRGLLWVGIGLNALALLFFRASDFFLPALEELLQRLNINTQAGGLQVLVPLGFSYYTLQTVSYLVDVNRGHLTAESSFVNFALYLAYFPKLIAGPIERARSFLPKLTQPRMVDGQVIARSLTLIFLGLVRKLLIADPLTATFLTDVFEVPAKYNPVELGIWLLIYAFSLYNDFAGYTDLVRGVSGLFGIELSANFRTPYFSRNFTEFWKRWHITLSEWLRDYIYFPLIRYLRPGKNAVHMLANFILPPMLTMLVSGLWHGLGFHMIIWGGLHGLYQIVERIPALWRPAIPPQNQPRWRQWLGMAIVFTLVALTWVPFRWELPAAFELWGALLNWSDFSIRYRRMFFAVPFLAASLLIDLIHYRTQDEFIFLKWPPMVRAACMAAVLFLVFLVTGGDFQEPFIYQAF